MRRICGEIAIEVGVSREEHATKWRGTRGRCATLGVLLVAGLLVGCASDSEPTLSRGGREPSNGVAWLMQDEMAKFTFTEPTPEQYVERVNRHLDPWHVDPAFFEFVAEQTEDSARNWKRAGQPRPLVRDWDAFMARPGLTKPAE